MQNTIFAYLSLINLSLWFKNSCTIYSTNAKSACDFFRVFQHMGVILDVLLQSKTNCLHRSSVTDWASILYFACLEKSQTSKWVCISWPLVPSVMNSVVIIFLHFLLWDKILCINKCSLVTNCIYWSNRCFCCIFTWSLGKNLLHCTYARCKMTTLMICNASF